MALTIGMITVDTSDPIRLARWWAERLGGEVTEENDGWFVVTRHPGGIMSFQKVDDPTPGKNRIHLDLTADGDLDETAQALLAAGASLVGDRSEGSMRWITLADPDGNQFCIAAH